MKNIMCVAAAFAAVAVATVFSPVTHAGASIRANNALVINVVNEEVYCVDDSGEIWSFFGDGYAKDEYITFLMSDSGTKHDKYDDVIIRVSKR